MAWKVLDSNGRVAASQAMQRTAMQQKALAAYRGTQQSRTQADWSISTASPDATLLPERLKLIYRIRERLRNDPVMRSALKKVVDSVVGPKGFNTQSQLDYERIGISEQQAADIQSDIDFEWREWQKDCDYSGNPARHFTFPALLSLQLTTELTCGETLTIPRYIRRPWARFSFCVQCVAPDRIVNPYGVALNQNDVRDGVRIGPRGEIVGVYIAKRHPGTYNFTNDAFQVDFVPALNSRTYKANFWHNFQLYRVEATRGEPAFASCLLGFKTLGDYVSDEATRASMAAMFGLAVTREEPFDVDEEGVADADKEGDTNEQERAQIELYPGMINYFEPGDSVSVVNPNIPGDQFDSFTNKLATWSGGALGLSQEQILNSYSNMSFSAAKASRDDVQRGFKKLQDDIIESYIEPPRERVIEEAWLKGRLVLPGFEDPAIRRLYFDHVTYAAPWPYLEPVKEETGVKLRLENCTSSLTRECSRSGFNLADVLRERAKEKKMFEDLGLELPAYMKPPPEPKLPGEPVQKGNPNSEKES